MAVSSKRRWGSGRERGAVSITVAMGMTVLIGSALVAVDLGHVLVVRTESQQVADAAAHAGASAFIQSGAPNIQVAVRGWAQGVALQNVVNNSAVTLLGADIVPDPLTDRVRVTVSHTAARNNEIGTVFGGVFGLTGVDVITQAGAEASPALGVTCAYPIFLVDRWNELGGDPLRYDAGIDYYEAYDPSTPSTTYTGYDQSSVGSFLVLMAAGGTAADAGRPQQDWYFPWASGVMPGGGSYAGAIQDCLEPDRIEVWGQDTVADGAPQPVVTGAAFNAVVGQDPTAIWDPGIQCVVDVSSLGLGDPTVCRSSARLRPVLLIDPSEAPGAGLANVHVRNLAGAFVADAAATDVTIILTGYAGVQPARASNASFTQPLVRTLRIIE